MADLRQRTCCFTGHRAIPEKDRPGILERTEQAVRQLLEHGAGYAGGRLFRSRGPCCTLFLSGPGRRRRGSVRTSAPRRRGRAHGKRPNRIFAGVAAQADKGRCSDVRLVGGEEQKPMSTPGAAAACSARGLLSPPAQGRFRWLREKRDAVRSTEI